MSMFNEEWMKHYSEAWNNEPGLADALEQINFNSIIGYGFDGQDAPVGFIDVQNGKVVSSGPYDGQDLNWDLRATEDNWEKWSKKPPGMVGLGMAYTTKKLKFNVGDYAAMVKDPRMAGPFIKSFGVMGKV
ncbi:MAG: SCP-2 sterol transfer family protein [Gammaproteobacteria bacterium]|nr:SCP-2 sterol transfer family protein [Gammaproteobacteria bacterium]